MDTYSVRQAPIRPELIRSIREANLLAELREIAQERGVQKSGLLYYDGALHYLEEDKHQRFASVFLLKSSSYILRQSIFRIGFEGSSPDHEVPACKLIVRVDSILSSPEM